MNHPSPTCGPWLGSGSDVLAIALCGVVMLIALIRWADDLDIDLSAALAHIRRARKGLFVALRVSIGGVAILRPLSAADNSPGPSLSFGARRPNGRA